VEPEIGEDLGELILGQDRAPELPGEQLADELTLRLVALFASPAEGRGSLAAPVGAGFFPFGRHDPGPARRREQEGGTRIAPGDLGTGEREGGEAPAARGEDRLRPFVGQLALAPAFQAEVE